MATFKAVFKNASIVSGPWYEDLGAAAATLAIAFSMAYDLEQSLQAQARERGAELRPVLTGLKYC